jgi:hypothetical protein
VGERLEGRSACPLFALELAVRVDDRVLGRDERDAPAVAGLEEESVVAEPAMPDGVDCALDLADVGRECL